jgi:hypothetical protein
MDLFTLNDNSAIQHWIYALIGEVGIVAGLLFRRPFLSITQIPGNRLVGL